MIYSLEKVTFSYNHTNVIDVDNLQIEEGKIYLLSGANGSGKTTFLKILNGLLKVKSGSVLYKSEPIELNNYKNIRQDTVYVHQTPLLLTCNVYNNVAYGLKIRKKPKEIIDNTTNEMLELCNLTELKKRTSINLSGGETSRVALARALALSPKVLLLDEPTAHLDRESLENIHNILKRFNEQQNTTVIFTSHGDCSKKITQETLFIEDGRIIKQ